MAVDLLAVRADDGGLKLDGVRDRAAWQGIVGEGLAHSATGGLIADMSENRERVAVPKGIGRPGAALALDGNRIADLDPAEEQLGVLVF